MQTTATLEAHFAPFREHIIGEDHTFETPYGTKKLIYADWIASGRLYRPIEDKIANEIGPMVGNTHSESSVTGTCMTRAYHEAQKIVKKHVNAGPKDVIIMAETGMTGVICKFQRILGTDGSPPTSRMSSTSLQENRPVVFITHMEHHSNQTSWLETIADVVQLDANDRGYVDFDRHAPAPGPIQGPPAQDRLVHQLLERNRSTDRLPPDGSHHARVRRLLFRRLRCLSPLCGD